MGTYSAKFLQLNTKVKELAETVKYSFVDTILNPSTVLPYPTSITGFENAFAFDTTYSSTWNDPYWNINFLTMFGITPPAAYYG